MHNIDYYINELSSLFGIIPEYYDISGNLHSTPIETKKAILLSSGINIDSVDSLKEEIKKRSLGPWLSIISPVHVFSINDSPIRIPLYLPIERGYEDRVSVEIMVVDEAGGRRGSKLICINHIIEERIIDGKRHIKIEFIDPEDYDLGYYDIKIVLNHYDSTLNGLRKKTRLIITPDRAYLPDGIKKWIGLSVNLYSLRSRSNCGVGDFADLKMLLRWFASAGGHLVGINPLHALSNTMPYGVSPYSPISRLYKNFIYLDMQSIVRNSEKGCLKTKDLNLVDYEAVASTKLRVLKRSFKGFLKGHYGRETELDRDFRRFLDREGRKLELFSTYMALSDKFNTHDWQSWPEDYQRPDSESVDKFMHEEGENLLFYQYIQWLIDRQHCEVCNVAKESGMSIGLYHDLAIGAIRGSCDVWCNKSLYALNMDVGAPPDDFSPDGQNWGFPPLIPWRLIEDGYELFIQILRKNMEYAGAIRIDHALGLFRLFWIPMGRQSKEGAYVRYPYEDLLRIIALESVRSRTIVIAEDLGTIGENVRENLSRFRLLSYRLFYFERNYPDPSFVSPSGYPDLALTAVTTHDLPTLYGYWVGRDIKERKRLGKYQDDEIWQSQLLERDRDKALIIDALKREGLLSQDFELPSEMTEDLCLAIYSYLMRTPSRIVLVSFDDMLGRLDQQNMPGVTEGFPNWRQKMGMNLEDVIGDSRFIKFIHGLVNALGDNRNNRISSPHNSLSN